MLFLYRHWEREIECDDCHAHFVQLLAGMFVYVCLHSWTLYTRMRPCIRSFDDPFAQASFYMYVQLLVPILSRGSLCRFAYQRTRSEVGSPRSALPVRNTIAGGTLSARSVGWRTQPAVRIKRLLPRRRFYNDQVRSSALLRGILQKRLTCNLK